MPVSNTVAANWTAYTVLAHDIKKRLSAGTFTGLEAAEQAAILDLCVGIGEKSSDPLGMLLDAYTTPRLNGREQYHIPVGTNVGG